MMNFWERYSFLPLKTRSFSLQKMLNPNSKLSGVRRIKRIKRKNKPKIKKDKKRKKKMINKRSPR